MDNAKVKKLEKKENDKIRRKKKSCKPPSDTYIDPANTPHTIGISMSMSGSVSKERWDKIFGKKDNKKRTNKKT